MCYQQVPTEGDYDSNAGDKCCTTCLLVKGCPPASQVFPISLSQTKWVRWTKDGQGGAGAGSLEGKAEEPCVQSPGVRYSLGSVLFHDSCG